MQPEGKLRTTSLQLTHYKITASTPVCVTAMILNRPVEIELIFKNIICKSKTTLTHSYIGDKHGWNTNNTT